MFCPACGHEMSEVRTGGIVVDVCAGGCGGIWFDNRELQKVDEAHEAQGEPLLDVPRVPGSIVDRDRRRHCPHCHDLVMMRHFTSVARQVTIDECPGCGGVFLDHGELTAIRTEFATDEERRAAARETFAALFEDELHEQSARSDAEVERTRRFARAIRYLLPSFWLPGKQPWGAY